MTNRSRLGRSLFRYRETISDLEDGTQLWGISFCHPPNVYHRAGIGINASGLLKKGVTSRDDEKPGSHEQSAFNGGPRLHQQQGTNLNVGGGNNAGFVSKGGAAEKCESSANVNEEESGRKARKPGDRAESGKQPAWRDVFAVCGGPLIKVYEARKDGKTVLLQTYEDEDSDEIYYSVAWTYNAEGNGEFFVLAGGFKGVLRVISVREQKEVAAMVGHGDSINDVKVHPFDPALVLTCSKDESLRLWNLRTRATVAVFAGLEGHRGDVLFADFNLDGNRFASCGIDNSIRVWDLTSSKIQNSISESHKAADLGAKDGYMYIDEEGRKCKLRIPIVQFPTYSSRKVHKHYVDCVMWLGDFLLSKSVHNRILLWKTEADRTELASPTAEHTVLLDYEIEDCSVWFVRFALDLQRRLMAVGNSRGVISVYRLDDPASKPLCTLKPPAKDRDPSDSAFIRQCAFSADGTLLAGVDDYGSIVRWDRNPAVDLEEIFTVQP